MVPPRPSDHDGVAPPETPMATSILLLLTGAFLLYAGAESLVRGSASAAARLGVTPLVIGLTVVAFGTSMPELAVMLVVSFALVPVMVSGRRVSRIEGAILLLSYVAYVTLVLL
jgi:cation:H+ antiporter